MDKRIPQGITLAVGGGLLAFIAYNKFSKKKESFGAVHNEMNLENSGKSKFTSTINEWLNEYGIVEFDFTGYWDFGPSYILKGHDKYYVIIHDEKASPSIEEVGGREVVGKWIRHLVARAKDYIEDIEDYVDDEDKLNLLKKSSPENLVQAQPSVEHHVYEKYLDLVIDLDKKSKRPVGIPA